MFERGTLKVGRYRGAPLLLHWSLALGLLAFGGIKFVPGFWVGFTLLILAHELGHAYLVRRLGFRIQSVVVHGFGGHCSWHGQASRLEHAIISWGGVVAQLAILFSTLAYVNLISPPQTAFGYQLEHAWVSSNLWIIAINLLPIAPFDGAEAWQLRRAMRVESVSFRQVLRRCLPHLPRWRRPPPRRPTASQRPAASQRPTASQRAAQRGRQPPPGAEPSAREGKPSREAERAIAEALQKIADEAREARRKK